MSYNVGIGYRFAIAEWTRANLERFDLLEITVHHCIHGGRWLGVYGRSLAQLERQWMIAVLASADGEGCADTGVT